MPNHTIKLNNAIEIALLSGTAGASDSCETVVERSTDPLFSDRAISNVSDSSLFMYKPEHPNGAAMLIAPGGGFHRISIDKEGCDIAEWLNEIGITAFVLKYRLFDKNKPSRVFSESLDDAIRAMRIIRYNADEYGISPDRIGVMGFSSGGYILARMGCCPVSNIYAPIDAADKETYKPAVTILVYSLITLSKPYTHKISREILLGDNEDEKTEQAFSIHCNLLDDLSPIFICHASDDQSVSVENSIILYQALRAKKASVDMHIFQEGGHGFGIRKAKGLPIQEWTHLCEEWMKRNKFIPY
jgi:acetyl esterase/lipase